MPTADDRTRRRADHRLCLQGDGDDPQRFARSSDVPALFGLVPRIDQSGEHEHIGSISKAGDKMMLTLLFEAADALLTRTRKSSP